MSVRGERVAADGGRILESPSETEHVQMPDGTWVISDARGFQLYAPASTFRALVFAEHFLETGSVPHTREFLAGALAAGLQSATRDGGERRRASYSLGRYVYQLAGAYQTTHATSGVLREAAGRFRAMGDARMADYLVHVAGEEAGHDELAVKDLEALGLRSAELVRDVQPAMATKLVGLFKGFARSASPVSALGYGYALQRLALCQTQQTVDEVEALLPSGTKATRWLRVHSAVGVDTRHVSEAVEFIAILSGTERKSIALAAFHSAACMQGPTDYPGDEAFGKILSRYKRC
jgi:hypothetical protein